jgi:hypothetical protein
MIDNTVETAVLLATATEEELGVGLFVGKLHELNEAGVDFGITTEQLRDLLLAINCAYELLAPDDGVPN